MVVLFRCILVLRTSGNPVIQGSSSYMRCVRIGRSADGLPKKEKKTRSASVRPTNQRPLPNTNTSNKKRALFKALEKFTDSISPLLVMPLTNLHYSSLIFTNLHSRPAKSTYLRVQQCLSKKYTGPRIAMSYRICIVPRTEQYVVVCFALSPRAKSPKIFFPVSLPMYTYEESAIRVYMYIRIWYCTGAVS